MKKMFSATEIAEMKLPTLPHTNIGVRQRAEREAWPFVVATGIGGKRKLYDVPTHYLQGLPAPAKAQGQVVGTIAGGQQADPHLLSLAIRALDEWLAENNLQIAAEMKGAIVSVLYNHLVKGGSTTELGTLLGAAK